MIFKIEGEYTICATCLEYIDVDDDVGDEEPTCRICQRKAVETYKNTPCGICGERIGNTIAMYDSENPERLAHEKCVKESLHDNTDWTEFDY
jgi:hypothetical protein